MMQLRGDALPEGEAPPPTELDVDDNNEPKAMSPNSKKMKSLYDEYDEVQEALCDYMQQLAIKQEETEVYFKEEARIQLQVCSASCCL